MPTTLEADLEMTNLGPESEMESDTKQVLFRQAMMSPGEKARTVVTLPLMPGTASNPTRDKRWRGAQLHHGYKTSRPNNPQAFEQLQTAALQVSLMLQQPRYIL